MDFLCMALFRANQIIKVYAEILVVQNVRGFDVDENNQAPYQLH